MYFLKILSYISLVILFINTIIYLVGLTKKSGAYISFVFYLLAICVIQVTVEIYANEGENNHFLSTYYLFFQFILLSCFFYHLFKGISRRKSSLIKYGSSLITVSLICQYIIYPELYYTFNSLGFLVTSSALIIYSVLYLFELISRKLPFHYVTIGIFVYLISSSIIFAAAASIVSFNDNINMLIWKINALLFIIYQVLILWEWMQTFYLRLTKQN
jgi:hypothetical protein